MTAVSDAERAVAEARRDVHEYFVLLAAPNADQARDAVSRLEAAVRAHDAETVRDFADQEDGLLTSLCAASYVKGIRDGADRIDTTTAPPLTAVPYLVRADLDKPHRCPACWTSGASEATGRTVRVWRAYTCPHCGQRFARRPLLRWYPEGRYGWRTRWWVSRQRFVRRPAERAYWWLRGLR
ncbi:hypothetical protein [Actinacidiphila sp. ITFR-21]|uniref:hypothetical protein n=1 Tax=Actinacidiphila sp. ITFR-21 TaxID=3075199 RepID=UPI00288A6769|nr:hypothetical protein [Streptomyces sp. ITFR-21]WNI19224.1 hypothetical protein RLT57_29215 [Streptomyces sp. ITFR-21]